jgi:hypothetical protein
MLGGGERSLPWAWLNVFDTNHTFLPQVPVCSPSNKRRVFIRECRHLNPSYKPLYPLALRGRIAGLISCHAIIGLL